MLYLIRGSLCVTYSRHPGDARVNARCVRDLASSPKIRQIAPNSAKSRVSQNPSFLITNNARLGPFLAPKSGLRIRLSCAPGIQKVVHR